MPLLEAMSFGTVPVTTRNTAMLDYIDDENAIIIEERRFDSPIPRMAADAAGQRYSLTFSSRFDVARACLNAMKLSDAKYEYLSANARRTTFDNYREEIILALVKKRLEAAGDILLGGLSE